MNELNEHWTSAVIMHIFYSSALKTEGNKNIQKATKQRREQTHIPSALAMGKEICLCSLKFLNVRTLLKKRNTEVYN